MTKKIKKLDFSTYREIEDIHTVGDLLAYAQKLADELGKNTTYRVYLEHPECEEIYSYTQETDEEYEARLVREDEQRQQDRLRAQKAKENNIKLLGQEKYNEIKQMLIKSFKGD